MTRTRIAGALAVLFVLGSGVGLRADVKADQKTFMKLEGMLGKMMNMFGGKAAREGMTSSVAVKGNRKITMFKDTGQIIDLDEEKVYELNLKNRSYKVTTFAEMRQKMEEARRKAEEAEKKRVDREEKAAKKNGTEPEMEVDFDVKETGQKKNVNGFDTKEVVMTITVREKGKTVEQAGGIIMTSDMWMAPKNAAMQEIVEFDQRYFQKLNGPMIVGASADEMAAAMAMYKGFSKGTEKMRAEGAKISGTPIQTTMTVDSVKSADQMAQEQSGEKKDEGSSGGGGGFGGLMGGLTKKLAQKKSSDDSAGGPPTARTTFMTTTHEVLKISTDVAAADLAIPAGFQQK